MLLYSLDILNNEEKIFFEHSIKEYITLINCKKNNLNKLILINKFCNYIYLNGKSFFNK